MYNLFAVFQAVASDTNSTTVAPTNNQGEDMLIDGLMQKRRNSSALAMELRLFCIKLSMCNS